MNMKNSTEIYQILTRLFVIQISLHVLMGDNTNKQNLIKSCLSSGNTSHLFKNSSIRFWMPSSFPRCWSVLKQIFCRRFLIDASESRESNLTFCLKYQSECHVLKLRDKYRKIACQTPYYHIKNISIENFEYCTNTLYTSNRNQLWLVKWNKKQPLASRSKEVQVGCELSCTSKWKLYRPDNLSHYLSVLVQSIIAVIAVTLTMITFLMDWKNQRKYPAVILFILSFLYSTCILGFLLQFFGMAQQITCDEQNRLRYNEPRSLNSYACVLSFILIYFSMVAITSWYLLLMYSWNTSFKRLESMKDTVKQKVKFLHLLGWTPSIILTSAIVFSEKIESHHVTGICFTGYSSFNVRIIFIVTPILFSLTFGTMLLISAVRHLYKLKESYMSSTGNIIQKAIRNLNRTIYRLCLYGVIMFITSTVPVILFIYDDTFEMYINGAYFSYVLCEMKQQYSKQTSADCEKPKSYHYIFFNVQFTCLCLSAIATSSWTWTKATYKIWIKFFRRKIIRKKNVQNENVQWFIRMNKKKIRPFIPPIDPDDPLKSSFPGHVPLTFEQKRDLIKTRVSIHEFMDDLKKMTFMDDLKMRRKSSVNGRRRRSSDDIRSVMELFSARRGTNISIESIYSINSMFNAPAIKQNRSNSLNALQSFGHLTAADTRRGSEESARNFVIRPLNSLDAESSLYDRVYTPISRAHKSNIVADCIPYDQRVTTSNKELPKTAPNLS